MKKTLLTIALIISANFLSFGQGAKTEFGKEFLPFWEAAKKQAIEIANVIPEDQYSFVPAKGGRSIEKMLLHIAYAHHFMKKSFIDDKKMAYDPYENMSGLSKAEIIKMMTTSYDEITKALIAITKEELTERVNAFGNQLNKKQMFYYFRDHATSHVGKLKMALRMLGKTPPRYRYLDF